MQSTKKLERPVYPFARTGVSVVTFDNQWNELHKVRQWGSIPNEHLVRFVKREFAVNISSTTPAALDIGCGAGAQSVFLESVGFAVDALDCSRSALERLPIISRIAAVYADVATVDYPDDTFSLVVDVCTLQHLPFDDAKAVIARAHSWLKPGGWFFSLMASQGFDMECEIRPRTASYADLMKLFDAQWKIAIGHERVGRPQGGTVAHWIIEAQKAN